MPVWPKYFAALGLLAVMAVAAIGVLAVWPDALLDSALLPRTPFVAPAPLTAGAYAGDAMWLVRPGMASGGNPLDLAPRGWRDPPGPPARAAVFFVPGTTSFASQHWNDGIERRDAPVRDRLFLRLMASPFDRAEVWAPVYRQAVSGALLRPSAEGQAALEAAYADVQTAFDAFIASNPADRPIVLAGHGQGALMVLRLLHDRVAGRPLAGRLVVAYAIGWPVSRAGIESRLGLPPCTAAGQPGCLASWTSFAEPTDPDGLRAVAERTRLEPGAGHTAPFVCTNPLTGGAAAAALARANLGTLFPGRSTDDRGEIRPGQVAARCDPQGWLLIGKPVRLGSFVQPGNNYSTYDIPLFWANLRADVAQREAGWYARAQR